MYTISSAGLNSENFAARSMTYRIEPPHTNTGSHGETCTKNPAFAAQMENPKNAHPRTIALFGVTPSVPAQPSFLNSQGAASINTHVSAPDMSCTSPMNALYACGDGCRILNWPFHATWNKMEESPCETDMSAKQNTSGLCSTNRNASNRPVFGFFGFFPSAKREAFCRFKSPAADSAAAIAFFAAARPAPPSAACARCMMYACVAAIATPQPMTMVIRNLSLTAHTCSAGTFGAQVPDTHLVIAPLVACAKFAPTPSSG